MDDFDFDLVGACASIQANMEDIAGQNNPFTLSKAVGALDMITSPTNGGVSIDRTTYDNRKKIARMDITYEQRTKPCEILTGDDAKAASVCDDGSTPRLLTAQVVIDKRIATPVRQFTNAEMVVICQDTEAFIRKFLLSDLAAARVKFDELLLAELDAMVGPIKEWTGDEESGYKTLQILANDGGQDIPLPSNYLDVSLDFDNMELNGQPAIIGQGYLHKYFKLEKMSCCNGATPFADAVEGADGLAYFYDQQANSVLGNNRAIVLPFGIVHLLTFNENRNININTQTTKHIVIPDPAGYPIEWDLDFIWDECDKVWKFFHSFRWTLFNAIQEDSFAGPDSPVTSPSCEDSLYGISGVFGYNFTRA